MNRPFTNHTEQQNIRSAKKISRYEADGSAPKELGQGLKAAADHFLDEQAGVLIVPDSKAGELVFLAL